MSIVDRMTDWLLRRAAPAPAKKGALWTTDQPYYVTGGGSLFDTRYRTEVDYAAAAGDMSASSAVMACVGWLMRAEPEAPWRLQRRQGKDLAPVYDHALLSLLLRPNPYYSGLALRQATTFSFNLCGNAYWLKARNAQRRVVELWYEPHFTIRAKASETAFLTAYEVYRRGQWIEVPAEDVIHFRDGLDPVNPRYGQSRLAPVLRHVAVDQEAARYEYAVLNNRGVMGRIYTPKSADVVVTQEDALAIKAADMRNFTGDHRGEPAVLMSAMDVHDVYHNPDDMNLDFMHEFVESRIAANLDTPAVIVGLLVGLKHSTYSNMEEAKDHAVKGNLIPFWRAMDDTINHQLVGEFDDPARLIVDHDLSAVAVLQDDQTAKVERTVAAFQGGIVTRNEARANLGLPPDDTGAGDLYHGSGAGVPLLPEPSRNGHSTGVPA